MLPASRLFLIFTSYIYGPKKEEVRRYVFDGASPASFFLSLASNPFQKPGAGGNVPGENKRKDADDASETMTRMARNEKQDSQVH